MRFAILGAAGLVVLAAMTGCKDQETPVAQGSTTCDPDTFAFLVGQDKSALDGVTVPDMVRVMAENSPATMDFHENRLNVIHDADGKVLKVTCG